MSRQHKPVILTELQMQALELYVAGHNATQIAAIQKCARPVAERRVKRAIELHVQHQSQTAEDAKAIELERLREMFRRVWGKAFASEHTVDLAAVDRALAIHRRVSALLGLDAPREHRVTLDVIENELRETEQRLEREVARDGMTLDEFYESKGIRRIGQAG